MSVREQEAATTWQNIAMAAAGFIMASAIIGAGIAGLAVGRQLAPPAATAPVTVAAPAAVSQAAAAPIAITIKGDPIKPYVFSPGAITVRAGQKVTLAISNPSAAMHGIAIPEFGVSTMIQPASNGRASAVQVSFTPTKRGVYVAHCIVYCGPGHTRMTLRVTVV